MSEQNQVGPGDRHAERHHRARAVAHEMRGPADDRLEPRDGVLGHQLERQRPFDIGRVAVAPAFGQIQPKLAGQPVEVAAEIATVGEPAVHQHQRVTRSVLVVPGSHVIKLYVLRYFPLPSPRVSAR